MSHIGPLMRHKQRPGGRINHICSYLQKSSRAPFTIKIKFHCRLRFFFSQLTPLTRSQLLWLKRYLHGKKGTENSRVFRPCACQNCQSACVNLFQKHVSKSEAEVKRRRSRRTACLYVIFFFFLCRLAPRGRLRRPPLLSAVVWLLRGWGRAAGNWICVCMFLCQTSLILWDSQMRLRSRVAVTWSFLNLKGKFGQQEAASLPPRCDDAIRDYSSSGV